jgi:hypothetical protein
VLQRREFYIQWPIVGHTSASVFEPMNRPIWPPGVPLGQRRRIDDLRLHDEVEVALEQAHPFVAELDGRGQRPEPRSVPGAPCGSDAALPFFGSS